LVRHYRITGEGPLMWVKMTANGRPLKDDTCRALSRYGRGADVVDRVR
jgi:hypothetical protein